MSINIVPNPLTSEPQSLGALATPWTSTHSDSLHTKYLRLHSYTEPLQGLPPAIIDLQAEYDGLTDDAGNPVWTSILHMRQSGLYVGSSRVVMGSDISVLNAKLDAFFGSPNSIHAGLKSHYPHLEDGWDTLSEVVIRTKGLHTLAASVPALETRVTALELNVGSGGATTLVALTDTDLVAVAPTIDDVLQFNGAAWVPAGVSGLQGPQGPAGADGAAGVAGAAGTQGPQGIQGEQGVQGLQGSAGIGVTFRGQVSADPPATGQVTPISPAPTFTPSQGDAVLSQIDDSLFIYDGSSWVDGGSIQGPQGAAGPQGIQGDQGVPGVQGDAGPQGIQGDAGPQGTIGPAGADGVAGVQGNVGPQGIQGAVGPAGGDGAPGADFTIDTTVVLNKTVYDAITDGTIKDTSYFVLVTDDQRATTTQDLYTDAAGNTIGYAVDMTNHLLMYSYDANAAGVLLDGTNGYWTDLGQFTGVAGASVTSASVDSGGTLSLLLSDGTEINVSGGSIKGADGVNGANGVNGTNGINGLDGADADNALITSNLVASSVFQNSVAESSTRVIGGTNNPTGGLFSWTTSTTSNAAFGSVNALLANLAPKPAPYIGAELASSSWVGIGDPAPSGASNGYISIEADTSVGVNTYISVKSSSITDSPLITYGKSILYSNSDFNHIDGDDIKGAHRQLGIVASQEITGDIVGNVSADGINYPANAMGGMDEGTLTMYLNGSAETASNATLSSPNSIDSRQSGTGFNLSAPLDGSFANGEAFDSFKHRTGTYHVAVADQNYGWNSLKIEHVTSAATYSTQYVEWFRDDSVNDSSLALSAAGALSNLAFSGNTTLSGVKYHTGGSATYSATVDNVYAPVAPNVSITFNETNVANIPSQAIVSLGSSETYSKQISLSKAVAINADSLLDESIAVSLSLAHPHKSSLSGSASSTMSGILLYEENDNSTDVLETFNRESYRLKGGTSYSAQSDVTGNAWVSTKELNDSTELSYIDGLMYYDGALKYPSGDFRNTGDGGAIANGPASNVNYTGAAGTRYLYRKFRNTSGSSKKKFTLTMSGTGSTTVVPTTTSLSGNNIYVHAKLPTTSDSQSTGYADTAKPFITTSSSDNAGSYEGSFDNMSDGNSSNVISFGTTFVSSADYIVLRITAPDSWSGTITNIQVTW